jgi:hypothetical protein
MVDRIRQFLLSIIGIAVFSFVFYLVFKDYQEFMIGFLIVVASLILIVLLVSLILRIKDHFVEKKRKKY